MALVVDLIFLHGDIDTRLALRKAYPCHTFPTRCPIDNRALAAKYKPMHFLAGKPSREQMLKLWSSCIPYNYIVGDSEYCFHAGSHIVDVQTCRDCGIFVYYVWYHGAPKLDRGLTYLGCVAGGAGGELAYEHTHRSRP